MTSCDPLPPSPLANPKMKIRVAKTFLKRAKGLIGLSSLAPNEGLLIERCNAIHTFFMRFSINATFLDAHDQVVKVVRNIPPWHPFVWGGWKARKVLETAASSTLHAHGSRNA